MRQNEVLISQRVKALLVERDISAAELARRLHISQSYVARRMTGRVPWRASDLAAIAQELGVDLAELIPDHAAAA